MKPQPLLLPFSFLYGAVLALRNVCFEKKIFRAERAAIPVISVGNITTGGTGKTPIVELIAAMVRDTGRRAAIVSRGYGRRTTGFVLVSDGTTVLADSTAAGDEAYQLARKLPGVVVIADEQRARGARTAAGRLKADVVVLDDGFQHRALERDCDIVLLDAHEDVFAMRMLPAGHRREPLSALRRADAIIITKCTPQTDRIGLAARIHRVTDASVFTSTYEPVALIGCGPDAPMPLALAHGKAAVVFCGIGQPESFRRSVEALGIRIASFHAFDDHHRFAQRELLELTGAMEHTGADFFLTTEKDARRLDGAFAPAAPLYYLAMEAAVEDAGKFRALIFSGVR